MSKVLTDFEVCEIVHDTIVNDEIDDLDTYTKFLERLGEVIADFFGGEFICVSEPLSDERDYDVNRHCLHFKYTEEVPEGGGIYARYDTDVSVEEWKNDQK